MLQDALWIPLLAHHRHCDSIVAPAAIAASAASLPMPYAHHGDLVAPGVTF
jgi:hypothetical protein